MYLNISVNSQAWEMSLGMYFFFVVKNLCLNLTATKEVDASNVKLKSLNISGCNIASQEVNLTYLKNVSMATSTTVIDQHNAIQVTETCPIVDEKISTYYVNHNGGRFYNCHDFVLIVPPGAVLQGDIVEIKATASRFGSSYQLPDGYRPMSNFYWTSANYTFYIPVYLIVGHHASHEASYKLHVMEACSKSLDTTHKDKLPMKELLDGVFFYHNTGYCVVSLTHFCSHCIAASRTNDVSDRFQGFCYIYRMDQLLKVELCLCHANKDCIQVCLKYNTSAICYLYHVGG